MAAHAGTDFKLFNTKDHISRLRAVEIIATELHKEYFSGRTAKNKARSFLKYAVDSGKLKLEGGGFVSGHLACLLRHTYKGHFIGWPEIADVTLSDEMDFNVKANGCRIPADPDQKDMLLQALNDALSLAHENLELNLPDAERWRSSLQQRKADGRKGGRPSKD